MIGSVALIIPFHSDTNRLGPTLAALKDVSHFDEVILAHNGGSSSPIESLPENIRLVSTDEKGIGAGYAVGIKAAQSEWVLLSASDLPFGFSDMEAVKESNATADVYIGSKLHPESESKNHGLSRLFFSKVFYAWRRLLLGASSPKDSQGTLLVRRAHAIELLEKTKSRDFFFSAEFLHWAVKKRLVLKEVPVKVLRSNGKSSVRPLRHGAKLLWGVCCLKFTR